MTESPARDIFGHIDWTTIPTWDSQESPRSRLQRAAEIYLPPDLYSEIQHFDLWSPDVDAPEGIDGSPMISGVAALYGSGFLEWRSRYPELFPAYAADELNFSAHEKAWNLLEGMPGRWLRVDLCGPGGFCHVPGPGIALNEIGVTDAPDEVVEAVSTALAAVGTGLMHGPERFSPLFSEGYAGDRDSTLVWGLAAG